MQPVMRRPLVAGNWKMHGNLAEVRSRLRVICDGLAGVACEVAVFPPYVHLPLAVDLVRGFSLGIGAQDVSEHAGGAFTGEVSASMLCDLGCSYALVGHSERRALFCETDGLVAEKFAAAQVAGLIPVLCVGETLAERDAGVTAEVVVRQLDAVLSRVGVPAFAGAVLAYEPVWAIGTGRTATPAMAQDVHALLRARLARADESMAARARIVYGGSVKAGNAAELFAMPDVDGGLVGGASLDGREFLDICAAAR